MNGRFTRSVFLSVLTLVSCALAAPSIAAAASDPAFDPAATTFGEQTFPASAPAVRMSDLAPADAYFGPLGMSMLGMRNELHDLRAAYAAHPERAEAVLGMARRTEDAVRAMEARYPRDTALPRLVYGLARLYSEVQTDEAREKAKATTDWMLVKYGSSPQANDLRREMTVATDLAPAAAPPSTLR